MLAFVSRMGSGLELVLSIAVQLLVVSEPLVRLRGGSCSPDGPSGVSFGLVSAERVSGMPGLAGSVSSYALMLAPVRESVRCERRGRGRPSP